MPFDHDMSRGGGGGDDRHRPIRHLVQIALEALGGEGRRRKLCLDCLALNMAGGSMALFLLQQEAVDIKTGALNEDLLRRLIQKVMDVAMEEVQAVVAHDRQERGE
jgi:hypothetical protein